MKKLLITFLLFLFFTDTLFCKSVTFDRQEMLETHNKLRKKYNSPPLKYSKSLENAAKVWAKKLQKDGCGMVHSKGEVGNYGENLFWASPLTTIQTDSRGNQKRSSITQKIKAKEVTEAWYSEVEFYDYETDSCKEGEMCGHYTQLIWNTTKEIGCAALSCSDNSQVWVCEYNPGGNVSILYPDGKIEKLKPY